MSRYQEYQPLKWPADYSLAQLHLQCSCPGKDNIEGDQCPCCGRYQKLKNSNWFSRSISKDFKAYGGGVSSYFSLTKYMGICFVFLTLLVVIYHIYILQTICDYPDAKCVRFISIFKFCNSPAMYSLLINNNNYEFASAFMAIQMSTFFLLILMTIGMKVLLHRIKYHDVSQQKKIYSKFSLLLKNVPAFYQPQDVQRQLCSIDPSIEVVEIFYLHQLANFQKKYKQLFDMHYQLLYYQDKISKEEKLDTNLPLLNKVREKYIKLYQQVQVQGKNLNIPSGRAVVMFNTIKSRDLVYKALKINQISKHKYYLFKLFGFNTRQLNIFADPIQQPYEVNWNYIGEPSVYKTKVRIQTTIIGIGFMVLCFLLLYFPIVKIDEQKILHPGIGNSILNILISLGLIFIAVIYRIILIKLIPRRKPSSKMAQSFFIIFSTVLFHLFFYLVAPVTYFLVALIIPENAKLAQFFVAVVMFVMMNILVAVIDVRYRLFTSKKNKLMKKQGWKKLCQIRLHEQLNYPSFPLEFKLMVIFNIWSFNAFYIFQIPYLIFLFLTVILVIYWLDKRNIYKHYKMQIYQSIDLEIYFQKIYIFLFLLCVCGGYAITVFYVWQYYMIILTFVLANILNFGLDIFYSRYYHIQQKQSYQKSSTLADVLKKQITKESFRENLLQGEMKVNFLMDYQKQQLSNSSKTLGSMVFINGYRQIYQKFVNQFKNKSIRDMLTNKYLQIKQIYQMKDSDENQNENSTIPGQDRKVSLQMSEQPSKRENNSEINGILQMSIDHEIKSQYRMKTPSSDEKYEENIQNALNRKPSNDCGI